MIETIIILKPQSEWREGVAKEDILRELNSKLAIPGVINSYTQPIINRINMLSTGIRTDVGVKIYGQSLDSINILAHEFKKQLEGLDGVADLYVEPIVGGNILTLKLRKKKSAGMDSQSTTLICSLRLHWWNECNYYNRGTAAISGQRQVCARLQKHDQSTQ